MPEDQAKKKASNISVTPEMAQEAIKQAQAEDNAEAKERSKNDVTAMMPDGVLKIAGRTAQKMSFARATIIVKALGLDGNESEDDDLSDDMEAMTVAIYVLFESSILTLHQLSKQPGALMERALEMSDEVGLDAYAEMAQYAMVKMSDLSAANSIGTSPDTSSLPAGGPQTEATDSDEAEKK
jgi:hypothetical protein